MQGVQWTKEQDSATPSASLEHSSWVRLLIGLLFTGVIFLFLHFREEHIEVYEINSIAPRYVTAQVDFSFRDDEKRQVLQQDAIRDIGPIWRLSDREVRNMRQEVDIQVSRTENWQELLPEISLYEMEQGIDRFQKALLKLRLVDRQTFRALERADIDTEDFELFTPQESQGAVELPKQIWRDVEDHVLSEGDLPSDVGSYLVQFYENRPWKVDEDIEGQKEIRSWVQRLVGEQYTPVQAGDRIIDKGERVTQRHLAMLQAMKRQNSRVKELGHPFAILGSLILSVLATFTCASYLYSNHFRTFSSNRRLLLLVVIVAFVLAASRGLELWVLNSRPSFAEFVRYPLFVPLAAILVCHLINTSVATFTAGFLTIILILGGSVGVTGMVLNLAASLVAIIETRSLRKRKEIFIVCAKAWIAAVWVIIAFHLYDQTIFDISMANDLISSALFLLVTAILVVGFLPLFETGFQIITDVTLTEFMDPSHELLRRLSIEAAGTYQHSVVVGSLAEAAALAIGANGLFCRVSTLFHDVGKLTTPQYFTENQQGDVNIHQLLTPQESAQVIIAHVNEGIQLGKQYDLPEPFIDIMREHHGTSLVYYFYRKMVDQMGGDRSKVDEKDFRYAGPLPRTKESGIIMIADTFEAASRSLDEVNEKNLTELIDKLVQIKIQDGQFDRCCLDFCELATIKKVMVQTLMAAGHSRIKYPKRDEDAKPIENVQEI